MVAHSAITTKAAARDVLDDGFGFFFGKRELCDIELQTELQVRVLVPWKRDRILTCIARRAVALSPRPDRIKQSGEAEVAHRIRTDVLPNLFQRVRRGNQLTATRCVDAIEAW